MSHVNKIYENSEWKSIIHSIDGVYIPLDTNWRKISIAVSGGADSALLSYLLCDLITKNRMHCAVHIISNIRCWKTRPWQRFNSLDVYEFLYKKFPNIRFTRHENFVPPDLEHGSKEVLIEDEYGKKVSGDTLMLRSYAEYVCHTEGIDAYYNAVTKNPDIAIEGSLSKRDVTVNEDNFNLLIMKHMNTIACHPFRHIDKKWIINQYKRLNLENLLNITRSCEGEFDNLNYKNYKPKQYVPVCNNCFWCKEREWGLNES